jgi:hypothetical protein
MLPKDVPLYRSTFGPSAKRGASCPATIRVQPRAAFNKAPRSHWAENNQYVNKALAKVNISGKTTMGFYDIRSPRSKAIPGTWGRKKESRDPREMMKNREAIYTPGPGTYGMVIPDRLRPKSKQQLRDDDAYIGARFHGGRGKFRSRKEREEDAEWDAELKGSRPSTALSLLEPRRPGTSPANEPFGLNTKLQQPQFGFAKTKRLLKRDTAQGSFGGRGNLSEAPVNLFYGKKLMSYKLGTEGKNVDYLGQSQTVGVQLGSDSRASTAPRYAPGKAARWAHIERQERNCRTPGPAFYD